MKKRLLAMLLAAVMVMAMLPTAFAASGSIIGTKSYPFGENLEWTYSNGVLTIEGEGRMDNYNYVYHVLQPWQDYAEEIHTVVIGDGVTYMGTMAFLGLVNLTSVTIGSGVGNIALEAFGGCENLTSVVIPNGVTIIDEWAFNGCSSLTSVTIPASVTLIGAWAFGACTSLTDIYYGGSNEQWQEVDKDGFNDPLLNANIHYNSTGPDTTEPEEPEVPEEPTEPTEPETPEEPTEPTEPETPEEPTEPETPEEPTEPTEPETPEEPTEPTTPAVSFTDVKEGEWFYPYVQWAVENKLMTGTGGGKFSPETATTRLQFLVILARQAGEVIDGSDPNWAQKAINWAVENGVSDGLNTGDPISREQMVTMLYRNAGSPPVEDTSVLDNFSDSSDLHDWAVEAMAWAVANGVVSGSGNKLNPLNGTKRSETATMLMNYIAEPQGR